MGEGEEEALPNQGSYGCKCQVGARQGKVVPCFRVSEARVPIPLCCLQKGGAGEREGDIFWFRQRKDFQTL